MFGGHVVHPPGCGLSCVRSALHAGCHGFALGAVAHRGQDRVHDVAHGGPAAMSALNPLAARGPGTRARAKASAATLGCTRWLEAGRLDEPAAERLGSAITSARREVRGARLPDRGPTTRPGTARRQRSRLGHSRGLAQRIVVLKPLRRMSSRWWVKRPIAEVGHPSRTRGLAQPTQGPAPHLFGRPRPGRRTSRKTTTVAGRPASCARLDQRLQRRAAAQG
jgi:hypothetical protein